MYKSPIEIITGQMTTQMEGELCKVVQSYGFNVNKEELTKALQYDRHQYQKGYDDGYHDGYEKALEDYFRVFSERII